MTMQVHTLEIALIRSDSRLHLILWLLLCSIFDCVAILRMTAAEYCRMIVGWQTVLLGNKFDQSAASQFRIIAGWQKSRLPSSRKFLIFWLCTGLSMCLYNHYTTGTLWKWSDAVCHCGACSSLHESEWWEMTCSWSEICAWPCLGSLAYRISNDPCKPSLLSEYLLQFWTLRVSAYNVNRGTHIETVDSLPL